MKPAFRGLFWILGILAFSLATFLFFPGQAHIFAYSELGQEAPPIRSDLWLNSESLDWSSLRGKVVLVDMWTFG